MDAATLGALEQVPRELFIPPALRHHSYENASAPIAYDQTISQPCVIAHDEALDSVVVNWSLKWLWKQLPSGNSCTYVGAFIR